MTGAPGTAPMRDPLRAVRRAVRGGQFRTARAALERLSREDRSSAEGRLLAAMTAWRLGEYAASRTAALQARDRFRTQGDSDGEMRAENVAASGALALGDLTEARRGFERALAVADVRQDETMTAHCATNLGSIAYFLGQHHVALGLYRLAAATFERLGSSTGLAMAWINAAVVWTELDDLGAARDAADRAVDLAEREGADRLLGAALAARAEAVALLGDRWLADVQARRALYLARAESDEAGQAEALRVLAMIGRLVGAHRDAEAAAREALDIAARVGDAWRLAEVLRELGEVLAVAGRPEEAHAAFAKSAEAFERLGAGARAEALRARR